MRAAAWVLAFVGVVLAGGAAHAQTPRERARTILRGEAYAFCRDATARVRGGDLQYCGYVDAQSACPEFARACALPPPRPPSCASSPTVGAGSAKVMVGILIAFTAALVFLLLRGLIRARRAEALVDAAPTEDVPVAAMAIPLATSAELLARALDAYARGDFRAALFGLYGALLRKLDERGVVRIDPARTNGDYIRQCEPAELKGPLQATVREVERVRFGGAAPSPEAVERLRAAVEPIVRALGVLVLAVFAAGALGACGKHGGAFGGRVARDTSASGHRAVRELLTAEGVRTQVLVEGPEDVGETARVVVLDGEQVPLEAEQWTALLAWVDRGGALVLAGGGEQWPPALQVLSAPHVVPTSASSPASPAAPAAAGASPASSTARVALAPRYDTPTPARLPSHAPQLAPLTAGYAVASWTDDDAPYAALVTRGQGTILVLASNELVTNGGLAVDDNAAVTVALVRAFADRRPVYFIEDAEAGTSNPLVSMARSGVLPLVLQALLVLGLFYLLVGRHFGTPRDRDVAARRAFAEHVRAVGGMYARARASNLALRAYARLVLERVRERTQGAVASRAEAVAARVGEPRAEVEQVLATLDRLQQPGAEPAAGDLADLQLIKRLNEWLKRLA